MNGTNESVDFEIELAVDQFYDAFLDEIRIYFSTPLIFYSERNLQAELQAAPSGNGKVFRKQVSIDAKKLLDFQKETFVCIEKIEIIRHLQTVASNSFVIQLTCSRENIKFCK